MEKLIEAFIIFCAIVCSYALCIILHEVGHLCMGKLTGYTMVSFRVGSVKLYKKHGKWTLTFEKIPGTLGQCIMLPPISDEPEKTPMLLYHFGGGFFNVLTAVVALPFYVWSTNVYVREIFILLFAISLGMALLNLVPAKINTPNDGYNMKLAMKNPADRKAMYHILQITGNQEQSLGEMPASFFEFDEEGEYGATVKMLRGYRHLDKDEPEEAELLFRRAAGNDEESMKYYRLEAGKEMLFCMIMRQAPKEEVDAVFDDELQEYLKKSSTYSSSSLRVLYAYDKLMTGDFRKADEEYATLLKLLPKLSPGDAKMEKKLLDNVEKCIAMQNPKQ